jgi:uncharacterized protein (DUF58 family)
MAPSPPATARFRVETALALSARLPDLLVAAKRIAANVMLGMHGRRQPGPGETFWQFRPYMPGESTRLIDWRRSARDDHIYIREREWEASQTVWLWVDLSQSMNFSSHLAETTKLDRAVILMLALADLLGRGGERVGIPGLAQPRLVRHAADRLAEIMTHATVTDDWPRLDQIKRFSDVVILSDFLADEETTRTRLRALAGRGAGMHLLQVLDPVEETFPYEGRLEFRDPESGFTWLSEKAGGLRPEYQARLEARRALIGSFARAEGSSFAVHHTDRSAAEGLLFLQSRLSGNPSFALGARDRGDARTGLSAA